MDDIAGSISHYVGNGGISVKVASQQYSRIKSSGKHVKTGETMRDELGRAVETVKRDALIEKLVGLLVATLPAEKRKDVAALIGE